MGLSVSIEGKSLNTAGAVFRMVFDDFLLYRFISAWIIFQRCAEGFVDIFYIQTMYG